MRVALGRWVRSVGYAVVALGHYMGGGSAAVEAWIDELEENTTAAVLRESAARALHARLNERKRQ